MRHKKLALAGLLIVLMASVAYGAVLTYYGSITSTVTVSQSILLDGLSWPDSQITDTLADDVAGNTVEGVEHSLTNQAEKRIVVNLVTETPLQPGITEAYPEYKLDAMDEDDYIRVALESAITWADFTGISFDYLMESDGGNLWIPQINIALRDAEGTVKYFAAWHSLRTGTTGTVGEERVSITYDKNDFYFYRLNWALLGLWSDTQWIRDSYASLTEMLTVDETNTLKDEIAGLMFSYFVQQAGDTAIDPNPAEAQQIVWVGNHATQAGIKGIIAHPSDGLPDVLAKVEFRMVYEFDPAAEEGTYTVVTNVVPLGFA